MREQPVSGAVRTQRAFVNQVCILSSRLYGTPKQLKQQHQRSLITITNAIIRKKFEVSQKLPKCDRETQSEQILLEKLVLTDLLRSWLAINPQFLKKKKKKSRICKCNKVKHNKTKQGMPVYKNLQNTLRYFFFLRNSVHTRSSSILQEE